MARQPRLILPHQPHYLLQRGNDNIAMFRDDADDARFLACLKEAARFYHVAIHAYVLTPSQVHLLATPVDDTGLATMMQKIGRLYVPWFNVRHGRSGTLFQGRFRTSVIDPDAYFLPCVRYIEQSPVRLQLVADAANYPWSSYGHHAGIRPDPLITDHARYWALGNTPFQREAAYLDLVQQGASAEELAAIEAAVSKGAPLASHAFKVALEHKTKRAILPPKRGRPFKIKPPDEGAPG